MGLLERYVAYWQVAYEITNSVISKFSNGPVVETRVFLQQRVFRVASCLLASWHNQCSMLIPYMVKVSAVLFT
jgi:hypothetical protein